MTVRTLRSSCLLALACLTACESTAKFRAVGGGFRFIRELPPPDDARYQRDRLVLTTQSPALVDEKFHEELMEAIFEAAGGRFVPLTEDSGRLPQFALSIDEDVSRERAEYIASSVKPDEGTEVWTFRVRLVQHTNAAGMHELKQAFEFDEEPEAPPKKRRKSELPPGQRRVQKDLRDNDLDADAMTWTQTRYIAIAARRGVSEDSDEGVFEAIRKRVLERMPAWIGAR